MLEKSKKQKNWKRRGEGDEIERKIQEKIKLYLRDRVYISLLSKSMKYDIINKKNAHFINAS